MIETATILLIVSCVCVGVVSAVLTTWHLRTVLYSLETRLDVVEGTLSREVKARAGQERWKKPAASAAQLAEELAVLQTKVPTKKPNWWENPDLKRSAPVG